MISEPGEKMRGLKDNLLLKIINNKDLNNKNPLFKHTVLYYSSHHIVNKNTNVFIPRHRNFINIILLVIPFHVCFWFLQRSSVHLPFTSVTISSPSIDVFVHCSTFVLQRDSLQFPSVAAIKYAI